MLCTNGKLLCLKEGAEGMHHCFEAFFQVTSFVEEKGESSSIHSCNVVRRYTIELHDKSLNFGVGSNNLNCGIRAREQLR